MGSAYRSPTGVEGAIREFERTDCNTKRLSIGGKGQSAPGPETGFYAWNYRMRKCGGLSLLLKSLVKYVAGSRLFHPADHRPRSGGWSAGYVSEGYGGHQRNGHAERGAVQFNLCVRKDCITTCELAVKSEQYLLVAQRTVEKFNDAGQKLSPSVCRGLTRNGL